MFAPFSCSSTSRPAGNAASCGSRWSRQFAGKLFDVFLSYRPAFGSGVLFNLVNLVLIAFLVSRMARRRPLSLAQA